MESRPGHAAEDAAPKTDAEPSIEPRAIARQRALRKDYLPDLRRARQIALVGVLTWPFFILYDLIETHVLHRGDFRALLALRIAGEAVLAAGYVALSRDPPPSHRAFHAIKATVMFAFSALLAMMCLATSGLTSIYVAGNMGIAVALIFAPQRFWQGLATVYFTISAHPLVLGIAIATTPRFRAQLEEPGVVGILAQYALVLVFLGVAVAGFGHVFHAMRRELAESRGIGRYRFRRLLGEGATSEVWAAYHRGLEREVALKILGQPIERDTEARKRFTREVRATAQLGHPNSIRIFDHGATEDGMLFYAMEQLEGPTLAEFVARRGPLPVGRALHLARQAASALAEAHARGIVHRDVKPENFIVTHGGLEPDFVKVLDFGIATIALEVAAGEQIATGEVAGTPTTMSPEVIRGLAATPASDVYGMGVVLYYMLTGEYPFSPSSSLSLYASHIRDAPPPPSTTRGERLPAALESLVLRCLAKEPAERPENAGELLVGLEAIAIEHPWNPRVDAPNADAELAAREAKKSGSEPPASARRENATVAPRRRGRPVAIEDADGGDRGASE